MGCPRLCDTPILEPVVTKKIAHERSVTQHVLSHHNPTYFRLTSLVFREECIVTACQDGYVCTWARPGMQGAGTVTALGGPPGPATGELGSPTQSNQVSEGVYSRSSECSRWIVLS